ncbi:hypothetical protein BDQ17DRAFT_1334184 [Cyathus striatus]|nr:hypothetical protein BDQ17DRAFT_1334184 [Cyathus striatus]
MASSVPKNQYNGPVDNGPRSTSPTAVPGYSDAFILYQLAMLDPVKKKYGEITLREMSKIIKKMWSSETVECWYNYAKMAEKAKAVHKLNKEREMMREDNTLRNDNQHQPHFTPQRMETQHGTYNSLEIGQLSMNDHHATSSAGVNPTHLTVQNGYGYNNFGHQTPSHGVSNSSITFQSYTTEAQPRKSSVFRLG